MSKLEEQKALPRRKLFKMGQDYVNRLADKLGLEKPKPKPKAKKAKRK